MAYSKAQMKKFKADLVDNPFWTELFDSIFVTGVNKKQEEFFESKTLTDQNRKDIQVEVGILIGVRKKIQTRLRNTK